MNRLYLTYAHHMVNTVRVKNKIQKKANKPKKIRIANWLDLN